jgi:glucose/arabinose dehydrogenase
MDTRTKRIAITALAVILFALFVGWLWRGDVAEKDLALVTGPDPQLEEDPDSELFPTIVIAKPIGWAAGKAPTAAPGLKVSRFAEGLEHPRTMLTLPNGDVIVALTNAPAGNKPGGITGWIMMRLMDRAGALVPSPDKLVLLRDQNGDGVAEARFVLREGLHSPSGIGYRDGRLYVADHDALNSFAFEPGQTRIAGAAQKLMELPGGGNHWMRNLAISPDGKIYIAVGSASNIGEGGMAAEEGRAAIWEYDIKRKSARQYAGGLRNPNGLDFNPATGELWTTVNERDMLGSDLVPDYLTNVPVGAQYGWPWVYWKDVMDHRVKEPMPQYFTEYTRKPEYALGPHVAALGLAFAAKGHRMGEAYGNGAFIARHGSWNRRPASGYDVIFVPFDALGNPAGMPKPVLTGFLVGGGETHGRPTWVAWDKTGALLVSDDTAGIIWRVEAPGAKPAEAPEVVKSTPLPPRRELKGGAIGTFRPNPDEGN